MVIGFWLICLLIFMTYPGYFILLILIRTIRERSIDKKDIEPTVSLIIAAYNEEAVIEKKLLNTLELDYPKNFLEIIVTSDCSADRTDSIVESYKNKGVTLVRLEKRGGKTAAQNESLKYASGDILVFSDANSMYRKDAIRKLVRNFNDPTIGCVGGRLTYYRGDSDELIKEKGMYLSFDQFYKKMESDIHTCIGVDGAIYAIRRSLARPLPDTLTTDFMVPLDVITQGYRAVFEAKAVTSEQVASSTEVEYKRKIRTVKVGMTVLYELRYLLNPLKYSWASVFLLFHKLFRWIFPFFLLMLLFSNLMILHHHPVYKVVFWLQAVFYLSAMVGFFIKRNKPLKIFTVPFYFCMYNVCAIVGLVGFLFSEKSEIWEVER